MSNKMQVENQPKRFIFSLSLSCQVFLDKMKSEVLNEVLNSSELQAMSNKIKVETLSLFQTKSWTNGIVSYASSD